MVVSILRIVALLATDFEDITYTAAFPLLWSFLEPALGITVACGPLLGPLVKRTRAFASTNPSDRHSGLEQVPFRHLSSDGGHAASEQDQYPGVITKVSAPNLDSRIKSSHESEGGRSSSPGIGVQTEWQHSESYVTQKHTV